MENWRAQRYTGMVIVVLANCMGFGSMFIKARGAQKASFGKAVNGDSKRVDSLFYILEVGTMDMHTTMELESLKFLQLRASIRLMGRCKY